MALVTDVLAPRRGARSRTVFLDHTEWRTTSADVVKALGIREGFIAPEAELEGLLDREEPPRARERAVRLLTYRERSTAELVARLTEDGYPRQVVDDAVDALVRMGLLDDVRFAQVSARVMTHVRGFGRSRVLRELAAKGIDPELARAALDEALPPDEERLAAEQLAAALAAKPGSTVDKVAARLARKGYAASIALDVARRAVDARCEAERDGESWDSCETSVDLREP